MCPLWWAWWFPTSPQWWWRWLPSKALMLGKIIWHPIKPPLLDLLATHQIGSNVLNILSLRQNGHHFQDDIFKCIIVNGNVCIAIVKFVPKGPINNKPSLIEIMAWCRAGDKPSSEPTMARCICVTWPWSLKLEKKWLKCPRWQKVWYGIHNKWNVTYLFTWFQMTISNTFSWKKCLIFSFLFLKGPKHSNEIKWNLNKIEKGLFLENRLHNVSCITTIILFRTQCVNELLRNPLLYTFSNLLHSVNYKILKRKMASMQITILSIANFSLCFCLSATLIFHPNSCS